MSNLRAGQTSHDAKVAFEEEMAGNAQQLRLGARDALAEYVAHSRQWDLFGTMTYDQRRLEFRASMWKCRRDILGWCRDAQRDLGRPMVAVFGFESQKNGWPHAHGLVDLGGLGRGDVATIGRLWFQRAGFNRLEEPMVVEDVARYAAKYVLKDENVAFEFFGRWEQLRWATGERVKGERRSQRVAQPS
jgi:hypothetical protein